MTLQLLDKGRILLDTMEYEAQFVDTASDPVCFYMRCPDLSGSFNERWSGRVFRFNFVRGPDAFTFDGRLDSIGLIDREETIFVTMVGFLEKSNRRKSLRIELNVDMEVYRIDPSAPDKVGERVAVGLIFDINEGGLCFLSDSRYKFSDHAGYIASFSIGAERFNLHIRHLRSGDCKHSVQFRYDIVFIFGEEMDKNRFHDVVYRVLQRRIS